MAWPRRVLAALALGLVVIGTPIALAAWGRYPTSLSDLRAADAGPVLALLTVVGWLAWGAFVAATVAELIGILTTHKLHLPGLGAWQAVAGGLLMVVLGVLPVTSDPPPPSPVAAFVDASTTTCAAEVEPHDDAAPQTCDYHVMAGDDLWSIAQRALNDGRRWRELAELNPHLGDPLAELKPGTKLLFPADAQHPSSHEPDHVVVKKGDTLSALAQEHLGAAGRWPRIVEVNPIITDPDHIEIGWRLRLPKPAVATVEEPAQTPRERHVRTDVDAEPTGPAAATDAADEWSARSQRDDSAPPSATQAATAPEAPAVVALTVGTLAAAALIATLELRSFLTHRTRPPGQHPASLTPAADRLQTSLRAGGGADALSALVAALRWVGHHCHRTGEPLPILASVTVGESEIALTWAEPTCAPPFGFSGDQDQWLAPVAPSLPETDHPCPFPSLVSLGTDHDGTVLMVDAERSKVLGVGGSSDTVAECLSAIAVELACAPWSASARIVVCGTGADLIALAGDDRVQTTSPELAMAKLRQVVTRRRQALATSSLHALRIDPERADAVAGYVFCFLDGLSAEQIADIEAVLDGAPLGVCVITATDSAAPAQWQVGGGLDARRGTLAGSPGSLAAHAINPAVRQHLAELLTERAWVTAPWWQEENVYPLPQREEEGVDIVRLVEPAHHPRLLIIGPAELHGAAGPEPSRSRQQLIELCAWMLEHPASTATQMAAGMAIAESTRRSNLSRLRNWLGSDPDGEPYLPDAYSGRISVHPAITSDWQQLQLLLAPGISHAADATLVAALEMVRGAPLADAAPGQWYWAEELRTEIASALRDVGLVLCDRALRANDVELARWAVARALTVAAEDELLLAARIRTEYHAGNLAEVERLVNQLTRQARILGVDLLPETVELCQQVIEGRRRARA